MRRNYNDWMIESAKELTPTGKIKRPSYKTVVNWINISWNAVDVNLIWQSFKCCGISNKRDRTEDELIFDYDHLGQSRQLNDEVEVPDDVDDKANIDGNDYDEQEENYDNVWDK